ncbi:hypothetical protein [Nonomuraea sp. NPDC005650]|uniref:hypothetical protein n=1 Tax=Nonomuraea sp. NPDC005650 TaxID=3157045 RepID=UPI0033BF6502
MSITAPGHDPSRHDLDRVLAEIEQRLVLDQAPPAPPPAPLVDEPMAEVETTVTRVDPDGQDDELGDDDQDDADEIVDAELVPSESGELEVSGETARVQRLRLQVAEAHELARLQADEAPLMLESKKLRKRRMDVFEAARLHELSQDPVALAYRDAKVRRITTVMLMTAAAIGLAVSSIGVQASVTKAMHLPEHSVGWWAAFLVELGMSLPLLATVGVQAYSAMRGKVVDRKSEAGRKMFRAEALLLTLTLVLNCWPAFVVGSFDLLTLIVHSLGPVGAVVSVWVLPALWSVLEVLPVPETGTGRTDGRTGLQYRANAGRQYGAPPARQRVDIEALTDRARALIAAGKLSADPGIQKIGKALGCGTGTATKVKKALQADSGPAVEGATS